MRCEPANRYNPQAPYCFSRASAARSRRLPRAQRSRLQVVFSYFGRMICRIRAEGKKSKHVILYRGMKRSFLLLCSIPLVVVPALAQERLYPVRGNSDVPAILTSDRSSFVAERSFEYKLTLGYP